MRNARKLIIIAGSVATVLTVTGLAAQEQKPESVLQAPMGQGAGMMQGGMMPMMGTMQEMREMMETCNKMMQAHMAQPQQPQQK